ncbi:uncharacterized protein NPIL_686341 [Nephila pilipes]|uniref:Uncharacterized protein n=1 Tax=Nephila pilipes TaxID=299642 RepID=A0A8X6T6X0_NEPPI|nr:uncharacterized protein NPIL_686341 [Nephila pilipes]
MLFVPSLENIAAVSVAVILYNDYEIQQSLKETLYRFSPDEQWKNVMREKMPNHIVSIPAQQKIMSFLKPINYEAEKWKWHHRKLIGQDIDWRITSKLLWKTDGTIARFETANFFIRSDILDIRNRFKLACSYWKKESVIAIWKKMPESLCRDFSETYSRDDGFEGTDWNVKIWIRWYTEEYTKNSRKEICLSSYDWNAVSLQGELPLKSTPEERLEIIRRILEWECDLHTARFCVLFLKADQRLEVLKTYPYQVLKSYLLSPCQSLFIEKANYVRNDLSEAHFICLLHIIYCQRVVPDWEDSDYVELLQEFWSIIPNYHKESVKREDIYRAIELIVANGRSILSTENQFLFHSQQNVELNVTKCCEYIIRRIELIQLFNISEEF